VRERCTPETRYVFVVFDRRRKSRAIGGLPLQRALRFCSSRRAFFCSGCSPGSTETWVENRLSYLSEYRGGRSV